MKTIVTGLVALTVAQAAILLALWLGGSGHQRQAAHLPRGSGPKWSEADARGQVQSVGEYSWSDSSSPQFGAVSQTRTVRTEAEIAPGGQAAGFRPAKGPLPRLIKKLGGGTGDAASAFPNPVALAPSLEPAAAPTLEEVNRSLSVPLALIASGADTNFTEAQAADLAEVAKQSVETIGATKQDPGEVGYADAYFDARNLADEQVWAISGQEAYGALVNQRAQEAGNPSPPKP